jgi:DNA repair protein RecO (recombination protein O)
MAGTWVDKLFPLPAPTDTLQWLQITGHFLSRELAPTLGPRALPEARARLITLLTRA